MRDPLAGLPEQARERAVAAEQPSWTDPMLATLTDRRFSDPGWVFEPKFDGIGSPLGDVARLSGRG
jgi:bifunctional non-homologous end joining protein LigD